MPLCGHPKAYKHAKTSKGSQRYRCPTCKQTFTETLDTIYYRRKVKEQTLRIGLPSYSEASSGLAYNTGVSMIRAASQKAQLGHNAEVEAVETDAISVDELWSFVEKSKNIADAKNQKLETAGLL